MHAKHPVRSLVLLCTMAMAPLALAQPGATTTPKAEPPKANSPKPETPAPLVDSLIAAYAKAQRSAELAKRWGTKADQDGYTQVGSLMRAVTRSHEIHMGLLEEQIKKLGGTAKGDTSPMPALKSTKENLEEAVKLAKEAKDTLIPAWRKRASDERNREAERALKYMRESTVEIHSFLKRASEDLETWRTGKKDFFVSRPCGFIVEKLDIQKCPVCLSERDKFEKVN
jgi:rubrerythrin